MRSWPVIALVVALPAAALALTVEGLAYPAASTIEGKELKLVGAGLREKWFVDVYVLAAYSEAGTCETASLIKTDETKYMRLDMLRDVSAEKMASTIGGSFDEHMPANASPELKQQRQTFEGYFKEELKKGTELEFLYQPGVGVSIKQHGKLLGPPLAGKAFQEVLWDIYFGEETCCSGLKKQILETCRGPK